MMTREKKASARCAVASTGTVLCALGPDARPNSRFRRGGYEFPEAVARFRLTQQRIVREFAFSRRQKFVPQTGRCASGPCPSRGLGPFSFEPVILHGVAGFLQFTVQKIRPVLHQRPSLPHFLPYAAFE